MARPARSWADIYTPPPGLETPNPLSAWLSVRHASPQTGGAFHSYYFDLGASFILAAFGPLFVEGEARQILLQRLHPESQWMFWPLSLYTKLQLAATFRSSPVSVTVSYRHDCKHDIEGFLGRLAVHDVFAISLAGGAPEVPFPGGFASSWSAAASAAVFVPPMFQGHEWQPDRVHVGLDVGVEPLIVRGRFSLFLNAGLLAIVRSTNTSVAIRDPFVMDWHIQAGARLRALPVSYALYIQIERINDDWVTVTPEPLTPVSVGIMISG